MPLRHTLKNVGDFAIHTWANAGVSISIASALGGRVVSLKDRISGREWLDGWAPASKRRLWQPTDPATYKTGPGAGLDECLPTVLPRMLGRNSLPDHGELWNQSPEFDVDPPAVIPCRWRLNDAFR